LTWSLEILILEWKKVVEDIEVPFEANQDSEVLSISQAHCAAANSPLDDNSSVANAVKWSVHACAL